MSGIAEIEKAVLALPAEQRAALIKALLDSLPPASEDWTEADELVEIERRELQIESEQVKPLSEREFWQRVEAARKR
jgi:hypothetical protein